ncbi:MAG: SH3 domain-containing protein [Proteobacteria bacterium]|nr:SH3 domain-containing protein [Pseudomonadota bacterium]
MILAARVKSLALVAALAAIPALAAEPAPQFATLNRDKVYLREGPSYQHRVMWIYRRKGLPVQILTKYDIWYRVKDSDGTIGWVSNVMISTSRRTVVVTSKRATPIRDGSDRNAPAIAYAQHGVVARLEACKALVCEVSVDGTDGWIKKQDIWGVGVGEVFK